MGSRNLMAIVETFILTLFYEESGQQCKIVGATFSRQTHAIIVCDL